MIMLCSSEYGEQSPLNFALDLEWTLHSGSKWTRQGLLFHSFWDVLHARKIHALACVEMWLSFSDKDELQVQDDSMVLSPQALSELNQQCWNDFRIEM